MAIRDIDAPIDIDAAVDIDGAAAIGELPRVTYVGLLANSPAAIAGQSLYDAAVAGTIALDVPTVNLVSTGMTGEVSGLIVSAQYTASSAPVLWVHGDSGNAASIYAVNTATGARMKTFNPTHTTPVVTNSDWEDMGYCLGSATNGGTVGAWYCFVKESTGATTKLYRWIEPDPAVGADPQNLTVEVLTLTGGPGYSEAFFVDPLDGCACVVQTIQSSAGAQTISVYRSATSIVNAVDGASIALTVVATLPTSGVSPARSLDFPGPSPAVQADWVGSADIAPDRSCALIKTYHATSPRYDRVFIYDIPNPASTSLATVFGAVPVVAHQTGTGSWPGSDATSEQQGEAIGVLPASDGYVRTSEGINKPLYVFHATELVAPAGWPTLQLDESWTSTTLDSSLWSAYPADYNAGANGQHMASATLAAQTTIGPHTGGTVATGCPQPTGNSMFMTAHKQSYVYLGDTYLWRAGGMDTRGNFQYAWPFYVECLYKTPSVAGTRPGVWMTPGGTSGGNGHTAEVGVVEYFSRAGTPSPSSGNSVWNVSLHWSYNCGGGSGFGYGFVANEAPQTHDIWNHAAVECDALGHFRWWLNGTLVAAKAFGNGETYSWSNHGPHGDCVSDPMTFPFPWDTTNRQTLKIDNPAEGNTNAYPIDTVNAAGVDSVFEVNWVRVWGR